MFHRPIRTLGTAHYVQALKDMIIGIDLGTRNALCAVSTANKGEFIIPNRWGTLRTPSVVSYAENTFLAGEDAVKAESKYPGQTWWDIKRKIGTSWNATYIQNGMSIKANAETLIVPLLKLLREDAEAYLNTFIYSCVITVPACFNSFQRVAILSAAREAGFSGEVKILNEPTAAALSIANEEGRYLVLDFGAGTADISVVEMESNVWQVLESVGTKNIGGYDFDVLLAEWIIERAGLHEIKENTGNMLIWNLFRSQAEKVKIALSARERYELMPFIAIEKDFRPLVIEREDFNRLIRFHIRRIVNWVKMLWEAHNPQKLLLVGGSSKIPLLRQMLEQEIIPPEYFGYCTEDSVVIGAAIHSTASKDSLLIDVISQEITLKYDNKHIKVFQKGTPLPANVREFLSVSDISASNIILLQDDIEVLDMNLDDIKLGEEIMVRISIDASGLLRVYVIRGSNINLNQSMSIQFEKRTAASDNNQKIKELESKLSTLVHKLNDSQFTKLLDLISTARNLDDDELIAAIKKAEEEILGVR